MLPYILAAVGGYLIGDSLKGKQFADGGMMAKGGKIDMDVIVKTPKGIVTKKDFEGFTKKEIIEWCEERGWVYNPKGEKLGGRILKEYEFFIKSPTKYNVTLPKKSDGGMMAKGGQVYKLGDKWSSNFDYDGMLETALKADVSWGMNKLRKLYNSFEDVNYHTASRSLWKAIESLKNSDVKDAENHLQDFRNDVTEELNS